MTREERENILQILKQIESGGGRNFNHPTITHGVNKGMNAIGNWGLTPTTVDDLIKRSPEYAYLGKMDPLGKKKYLESNPDIEKALAEQLVDQVAQRQGNDPRKIAYAWNHGTYLNPNRITPEILEKDDYTNKFTRLSQKLGGNNTLPLNNQENNEKILRKPANILPTIGRITTLEDIVNDPNNPFNQPDESEDEDLSKYFL